jgi:hypothetical protein
MKRGSATKHTYYVVATEAPRQFQGIICPIDLYKLHVLLEGGTMPLSGTDTVAAYRKHLETQGISFSRVQSLRPDTHILWVDTAKTDLYSYAFLRDLDPAEWADPSTVAWKTYYIPCQAGTKKEALGFWVCAQEERLGGMTCAELFQASLGITI